MDKNRLKLIETLPKERLCSLKKLLETLLLNDSIKLNNRTGIHNTLVVVLTEAKYNKNNNHKHEFVGKTISLPSEYLNIFNPLSQSFNLSDIFEEYLNERNLDRIVITTYNNTEVNKYKSGHKELIFCNYKTLGDVVKSTLDSDSKYTLYLFENMSWDILQIVFSSFNYRINGGSHTRRHIVSPLDLRVLDFVERIRHFGNSYIENNLDLSVGEILNNRREFRNLLDRLILKSYITLSEKRQIEFKNVLNIFKALNKEFKWVESKPKDDLEVKFIYLYEIIIHADDIYLVMKDKAKSSINTYLNCVTKIIKDKSYNCETHKIEDKLDSLVESPNTNKVLKVKGHINGKGNQNVKGNRGIHTLNQIRFYSSSTTLLDKKEQNLLQINPLKIKYYQTIKEILNSNMTTLNAQMEIEKQWNDLIIRQNQDNRYLVSKNFNIFVKKLEHVKETLNILDKTNVLKTKFTPIHEYLNDYKVILLTYGIAIYGVNMKLGYNNICNIIGRKVIFQIYCEHIDGKKNISFEDFYNSLKFDLTSYIYLGSFLLDLLILYPTNLFEKSFNRSVDEMAKLVFNETHFEIIRENLYIDPSSLPMVHEPGKWSNKDYGGFLLNKTLKESIITGSTYHGHKTEYLDKVYSAVNKMSSIKFNYNKSLLEYLKSEGSFLLEYIYSDSELTKSEKLQIETQMNIAEIYSHNTIYIPLQIDWRGRIYVKSFFANYQGSDLSLSLIEFNEGKSLNGNGLESLYIYGANLYNENNISKASFEDRINWTKMNNTSQYINNIPYDYWHLALGVGVSLFVVMGIGLGVIILLLD